MSIRLQPFRDELHEQWDRFVDDSRNGTLFHKRQFLKYHPADRFKDASCLFFDGDRLLAVLPAAVKDEDGVKVLAAHPGASYGGLVLACECSVTDTGAIIDLILAHAREQKYGAVKFLRLPPPSIRAEFSDDQEYWLFQRGFRVDRFEMDGSIDLCGWTKDIVLEKLSGKCRNMVRQAERAGITTRWIDGFTDFWPLLEATLSGRHKAKPTHTLTEIEKLKGLLPKDIRLCSAFKDKQMIGGIVVITLSDHALYTLYIAQDYAHQKDHPVHAVLTEVIRMAIAGKRTTLHLGVSTEDGGKVLNEGLTFFKESFGMKPVRRESWELRF